MTVDQIISNAKRDIENVTGLRVAYINYKMVSNPERIPLLKNAVCRAYKITEPEIMMPHRFAKISEPRQMFYYLAIERLGMTVTEAAKVFNHHHTTAIFGREKIRGFLKIGDPETIEKLQLINNYLNEAAI